jgi:molecular chaperone GrpE (heat shock protein)
MQEQINMRSGNPSGWFRVGRIMGLVVAFTLLGSLAWRPHSSEPAGTVLAADKVDEAKEKSMEALEAIAQALEDMARRTKEQAQKAAESAAEHLRSSVERACDAARNACEKVCDGNDKCLRACKEGRKQCQA